jgi:hypothetical protein
MSFSPSVASVDGPAKTAQAPQIKVKHGRMMTRGLNRLGVNRKNGLSIKAFGGCQESAFCWPAPRRPAVF